MNNLHATSKLKHLNWLLLIAVIILLITLLVYLYNFNGILSHDNAKWGTFGDFMGGTLNPLFALLSLFAIIYTIRIQTEELELTRREMQKSNEALDIQSKTFEEQKRSIQQQTIENTFYKLLEHHNSLIDEVYKVSGDYYFKIAVDYRHFPLVSSFMKFNNGEIKTFFMTFYQILKFIKRQEEQLKNEQFFDPKLYTNILRATFDDGLLCLLAINCKQEGFEKFEKLLVEYDFLEHLNIYGVEKVSNPVFQERILDVLKMYDEQIFAGNQRLKQLIRERNS